MSLRLIPDWKYSKRQPGVILKRIIDTADIDTVPIKLQNLQLLDKPTPTVIGRPWKSKRSSCHGLSLEYY